MQAFRTFHNYLHITDKAVDHAQRLRNSHPSLILGQSIQPLDDCLYLTLPQQLLREFLCGTLSRGQRICEKALTEPALFNLFGRQGKYRE